MAVSIDIERGIHYRASKANKTSASRPGVPLLRRRKGLFLIICFSLILVFFLNANRIPDAHSSLMWVKDSMKPSSAQGPLAAAPSLTEQPLASDFDLGVAQVATAGAAPAGSRVAAGSGTDALKKFAKEQGFKATDVDATILPGSTPSSSEHILLLLLALSNPAYEVPDDESRWRKQLLPAAEHDFAESLREVSPPIAASSEVQLFLSNRSRWSEMQQRRHPLTVFSKSYCPFSRQAKELLHSLGANYTIIEVDKRAKDSHALQAALGAISGHRTFPTVFARDRLLGGSDDLQTLSTLHVLPGMLKAAGAL